MFTSRLNPWHLRKRHISHSKIIGSKIRESWFIKRSIFIPVSSSQTDRPLCAHPFVVLCCLMESYVAGSSNIIDGSIASTDMASHESSHPNEIQPWNEDGSQIVLVLVGLVASGKVRNKQHHSMTSLIIGLSILVLVNFCAGTPRKHTSVSSV